MKYVRNSLEMYGMGSEIERYGVDSWKKSDISEKCWKSQKMKVLRMKFSIVENVRTSRDIIFKLSPASQRPYGGKTHDVFYYYYSCLYNFPIYPLFGVARWGHLPPSDFEK